MTKVKSLVDGIGNETLTEKYYDDWALNYDQTLKNWNYKTPLRAAQAIFKIKDHINKITDTFGVDLVIDCSGVAEGFGIALDLIREGGMVLEVGIFSNSHDIPINPHSQILEKSARVIGVGGDDISQYYPSIKLLDRTIQQLPWKKIISHNYNIANVHEAMDRAMSDKSMKVLLNP